MSPKIPATPALRFLRQQGIAHEPVPYPYEDQGGAPAAAAHLGLDLHTVIKTLVMADNRNRPFLVLMHGDRKVSTKALARHLGARRVFAVDPATALAVTGYQVGGISPFGTKKDLAVVAQASIADLDQVHVNAGKRGLLVKMSAADLLRATDAEPVDVARPDTGP